MAKRHLPSQCLTTGSMIGSPNLAQRIPKAQFSVLLSGSILLVVNSLKPVSSSLPLYSVHTHCCDPNYHLELKLTVHLEGGQRRPGLSATE